jgi:hypothetical protein
MNTIPVNASAYCSFAFMVAEIYRILRQINVKPALPRGAHEELRDNSRIQTIDVQLLFDWHDLVCNTAALVVLHQQTLMIASVIVRSCLHGSPIHPRTSHRRTAH